MEALKAGNRRRAAPVWISAYREFYRKPEPPFVGVVEGLLVRRDNYGDGWRFDPTVSRLRPRVGFHRARGAQ